jgi:hypothetical protein
MTVQRTVTVRDVPLSVKFTVDDSLGEPPILDITDVYCDGTEITTLIGEAVMDDIVDALLKQREAYESEMREGA